MHVLFANTGVQLICVPLAPGDRFAPEATGKGWQSAELEASPGPARRLPFVQWQVIAQSTINKLFLAIDTTTGRPDEGYVCSAEALDRDYPIPLDLPRLLDVRGRPLGFRTQIEAVIRPLGAGDPKAVDLVVDVGNSRTGALLLEEDRGARDPVGLPFTLINRYHLDAWDDRGQFLRGGRERWFSSQTHWSVTPYREPPTLVRRTYRQVSGSKWFGSGPKVAEYESPVTPDLFLDWSMVRMGSEAEDVTLAIRADGDLRTGVSSPKRYLWADDASWLDGADWFMADPHDRFGTGVYAVRLQGKLLRYLYEDDRDVLLTADRPGEDDQAEEAPIQPRHAPRSMMVAALYELLCQAYTFINSTAYLLAAGDAARPRILRSLTLTYPSGMVSEERRRLEKQARKASRIFHRTLGRNQPQEPHVTLEIDEASAVHFTYIWSELQMTGLDPALWFTLVGRDSPAIEAPEPSGPPPIEPAEPPSGGPPLPSSGRRPGRKPAPVGDRGEVRIACIDIGGGTTDFMVARYVFRRGIPDSIEGEVIERDGISIAGDQIVKRLLERVVVPAFAEAVGLDADMVKLLFGPQVPRNLEFRAERINWMNRLFVPLAQRFLDNAVGGDPGEISHTDPDIVSPEVLESLETVINRLKGQSGYYAVREPLGLSYEAGTLDAIVHEVFSDMLHDFCRRIVKDRCDVVLLAGQPTKLDAVQGLVRLFLPLPPSRIVPMYQHYAGTWYPYQDEAGRNPGVIVDPKSAVVVGAAIHFRAKYGMLRPVKFEMKDPVRHNAYYWGVMNESNSRFSHILFEPGDRRGIYEFETHLKQILIGRRLSESDRAQASPVYVLKLDSGDQLGEIAVKVRLRRVPAGAGQDEETLELETATGKVADDDAIPGENVRLTWQTLADERYYLDTGGLDNIQFES